ncbi:Uracil-DNA glycosylase [Quadrisphaera granulorum]|uniref:Uracil-DNA glycosylase n=1 Tax=Quadrisphaera granulorum TaxID=317664 RepID=A0A315ZRE8_9ACTN|nr:uracil-DNA glycosylase [Quadrisphaera granulorum]PWJ47882.1 uracil-DNA glycosylase [Quadrisphaera granulorum]SZE98649.1 Uracil-DNA glycosylase [Quadrisphaera granulorum]
MFLDHPRGFRDAALLDERRALLQTSPAVQPLREWSSDLERRRDVTVPDFDPAEAGVDARVLIVHEAPGPMAAVGNATQRPGSGFICVDNNDQSAANMWSLRAEADLRETEVAHWNIVPWYLGPASVKPTSDELRAGARELRALLTLFTRLEVVVLSGLYAQRGWMEHLSTASDVVVIPTWHPGAQSLNRPGRREEMLAALQRVRGLLGPVVD